MLGNIKFDSELGLGIIFIVFLLMVVIDFVELIFDEMCLVLLVGLKVLIVEDNDINVEIIIDMFKDVKIKCIRVKNGKEVFDVIVWVVFDLVFMDC